MKKWSSTKLTQKGPPSNFVVRDWKSFEKTGLGPVKMGLWKLKNEVKMLNCCCTKKILKKKIALTSTKKSLDPTRTLIRPWSVWVLSLSLKRENILIHENRQFMCKSFFSQNIRLFGNIYLASFKICLLLPLFFWHNTYIRVFNSKKIVFLKFSVLVRIILDTA